MLVHIYLSEGEGEVVRLEVAEALVQGGQKADLGHVLHAQLLQQGVLVEDDLLREVHTVDFWKKPSPRAADGGEGLSAERKKPRVRQPPGA